MAGREIADHLRIQLLADALDMATWRANDAIVFHAPGAGESHDTLALSTFPIPPVLLPHR